MRVVVVLGSRALLPPDEGDGSGTDGRSTPVQRAAAAVSAIAAHHAVVAVHGNGPQFGLFGREAVAFRKAAAPPGAVPGASPDGIVGYLIERALMAKLPGRRIATMLLQTEVSADDPAFAAPDCPVGPGYDADRAARLAAEHHWTMGGAREQFRRLIALPRPLRLLETETVRLLLERNVVVICPGGGGIPVLLGSDGEIRGVDAAVERDAMAALLAAGLAADFLLILSDVDAVYSGWGTRNRRAVRRATPDRLRAMTFDAGTMGPKVEAACAFVTETGGTAAIGRIDQAAEVLRGGAGTTIAAGGADIEYREG